MVRALNVKLCVTKGTKFNEAFFSKCGIQACLDSYLVFALLSQSITTGHLRIFNVKVSCASPLKRED